MILELQVSLDGAVFHVGAHLEDESLNDGAHVAVLAADGGNDLADVFISGDSNQAAVEFSAHALVLKAVIHRHREFGFVAATKLAQSANCRRAVVLEKGNAGVPARFRMSRLAATSDAPIQLASTGWPVVQSLEAVGGVHGHRCALWADNRQKPIGIRIVYRHLDHLSVEVGKGVAEHVDRIVVAPRWWQ